VSGGRRAAGVTLTPDELAGDLPMVCVLTGRPAEATSGVWFARSSWWAWVPLGLVLGLAIGRASWAPLASWWAAGAVLLPILVSRGVAGRVPLDRSAQVRLARLRRRRSRTALTALGLTWVAVALHLLGARAAGVVVLAGVLALYLTAIGTVVAGRMLTVRGRPTVEGGVRLTNAHPAFVDAVELRRTGHRP
jgi:hypothetical protein